VRIVMPPDASLDGHLVDGAIGYLTLTTGVAFAVALLFLLGAIVFHRARAGRTRGQHTHGNRTRDRVFMFAVALVMFVAIDVTLALRTTRDLEERFWRYPNADPTALRVEVTARQWAWTFRTAGPDGRFGTGDDVVTLNELDIPVGRPIYLKLRSRDVVHSLYLPNFRTKIDAIPGMTTRAWFQATIAGRYEIACAQHCGVNHYKMRGLLHARTEPDYRDWLARAETDSRLRFDTIGTRAITPFTEAWDWETGK
jgi:cytochrome c oxidase subunit 2